MSEKQNMSDHVVHPSSKTRSKDSTENGIDDQQLSNLRDDFELIKIYQSISKKDAWKSIQRQTTGRTVAFPHVIVANWRSIAAILIPLLVMGFMFVKIQNQKALYAFKDVKPGNSKAILLMPNGAKVSLPEYTHHQIFDKKGIKLGTNTNNTFFCEKISDADNGESNIMYVPTGGEYKLVLSDGTQVSVNSDSRIQFPYSFQKEKREVSLVGEAFFEVAKNEKQPFEVHTRNSVITVLGTKFNVSSYSKEQFEKITLEQGAVSVKYQDQFYSLVPGMQLLIDTKTSTATINEVDANLYSSWKEGLFRFQNMSLDDLTQKIERWYNVQFVFENDDCKTLRFTGAYARNANFNDFIYLIESTTGVNFTRKDDKIIITKK